MHIDPNHFPQDLVLASGAGVGASLALTTAQAVDPNNPWSFLSLIPTILGPAIAIWMNRRYAVSAARKRAEAKFIEQEAAAIKSDSDPNNDGQARDLLLEAAKLKAEADALEGRKD